MVASKETSCCPICSHALVGYDRRCRNVKDEAGLTKTYSLRRLKCKACNTIHTELPSFIHPYKHYESNVIEKTLNNDDFTCPAEDSTIGRWRKAYKQNKQQIEGILRCILCLTKNYHKFLFFKASLLAMIKNNGPGWLTVVSQSLINFGFRSPTQFAWQPNFSSGNLP